MTFMAEIAEFLPFGRLMINNIKSAEAESHRERAQLDIFKIADSFAKGEPLREAFLSAAPSRKFSIHHPRKVKQQMADTSEPLGQDSRHQS